MKRTLCLWFPDWPIQRRIATRPELQNRHLLLKELARGKEIVRTINRCAREIGVRPGMSVADAQSLASVHESLKENQTLIIEPTQPEQDRRALEKIALACERFSPCVGIEDLDPPECLLLDITGVAHLFKGEEPLSKKIAALFTKWKLIAHIAVGDSVGAAWAAAHFLAKPGEPAILPPGDYSALLPTPVAGLRLSQAALQSLGKLGVRVIGQLLKLDRHSLPARFGRDLSQRLEQFLARREELITPHRPPPRYELGRSFEEGLSHQTAMQKVFESLLRKLMEQLRTRGLGVSHIQCQLKCDDGREFPLAIRLCQLTNRAKQVCELFRLQLERTALSAPIVEMHLQAVQPTPMQWEQLEVFAQGDHTRRQQLSLLLNRLSNRLGDDAVTKAFLTPYPIPEISYSRRSITSRSSPELLESHLRIFDRPFYVYPEPISLEVVSHTREGLPAVLAIDGLHWKVVRLWGPERIESGWHRGPSIRRDYYHAELASGRRLWIFYHLVDRKWLLHGDM